MDKDSRDPMSSPAAAIEQSRPASLFSLDGKVAIVTGAAGGIGRWLAAGLGAAGARLHLTDITAEPLDRLRDELRTVGITAESVPVDLAEGSAAERITASTLDQHGQIDVLINCAGTNLRVPLLDVDVATYDHIMRINLRLPFLLAQHVARAMIERGAGGSIINIGSVNVAVGLETVGVYGPSKAGLSQLTKVMAVEWTRYGIRANCISPGFMDTPLAAPLWADEERRRWILDRTPMSRPGEPRELVGLCTLLASDAASYITGQTIYVDGGFLAGSRWGGRSAEEHRA